MCGTRIESTCGLSDDFFFQLAAGSVKIFMTTSVLLKLPSAHYYALLTLEVFLWRPLPSVDCVAKERHKTQPQRKNEKGHEKGVPEVAPKITFPPFLISWVTWLFCLLSREGHCVLQ